MRSIAVILVVLLAANTAHTATLVATSPNFAQQGLSFQQHQYLAQEFAMGTEFEISNVQFQFFGNIGTTFNALFQIVRQIGPSTAPSDVLLSQPITIPAGEVPTALDIPVATVLNAGVYYLLLSTSEPLPLQSKLAMGGAGPPTPGVPGNVYFSVTQDVGFPAASPFVPFQGFPTPMAAFAIEGRVLPEPGSAQLAVTILLVGVCLRSWTPLPTR